jgi:hypothetical protein
VSSVDQRLDDLCLLAASAAGRKGHDIHGWGAHPRGVVHSRRATCRKCGRWLSVGVGDGMTGIAGPAMTEACG